MYPILICFHIITLYLFMSELTESTASHHHYRVHVHTHADPTLSHLKQEGGCICVNNAGPWSAFMHLGYHGTEGSA